MLVGEVLLIQRIRINLPPNFQQGQIPLIIQGHSNIDRRRHFRINADHLLLDQNVSKTYFNKVIDELEKKGGIYKNIWKIKNIFYPNIFIDILSTNGKPLLVLSLNCRNYNYFPPQVGFLTPDEKLIKKLNPDAIIPDDQGINHLIKHNQGVWACTPGTYEYHDFYFDLDRWELERYGSTCNIIELINRIIGMINRSNEKIHL